MPKRYRSKSKRRRVKRSRKALNRINISKVIEGSKLFLREDRQDTVQSPQNVVYWKSLLSANCYSSLNTILTATGQSGALGSMTDDHVDYRIYGQSVSVHLRNVSNHPAYVTLYEVMYKDDHNIDSATNTVTSCADFLISQLHDGWDKYAVATQFDRAGTGTLSAYTAGNDYLETDMKILTPNNSSNFKARFKTIRKIKLKMKAGDDFWFKVRPRS